MKTATLAIIVREGKVLLGYKKKGEIGTGTLNGPGGKTEEGESLVDCVVRETQEELAITLFPEHLKKIAHILFFANGTPDFEVTIFYTSVFSGEPRETADMIPSWHSVEDLPIGQMLESDRMWFPKAVRGEMFSAHVYYKERARSFDRDRSYFTFPIATE